MTTCTIGNMHHGGGGKCHRLVILTNPLGEENWIV